MGEIRRDEVLPPSDSSDTTMETDYRDQLERNRLLVVQSLDLERHFMFNYLRSNKIFDEEDCDIIQNCGATRQQKNAKFLDVLATRGPNAFHVFVEALEYDLPSLYEVFTGRKPQIKNDKYKTNNELEAGFDREFLSKELSNLSEQYHKLTYMHQKTQKENEFLKRQNQQFSTDLSDAVMKQEELKFELSLKNTSEFEANQSDKREKSDLLTHCQALVQDSSDKSNIIIALQARLLAVNEDRNEVNRKVEEFQMRNKDLMQQVKDLTINYDFQRTRSIRLQEKYEQSHSELSKSAAVTRELHLAKFNLTKANEENDALHKKLDEYRNVVPALNAKLCLLQEQNEVESEKRTEISEEYFKIRQQAKMVEVERDQGRQLIDFLKEKIDRVEQTVEGLRDQTRFLSDELDKASCDRNRAVQEREEIAKYNNELLLSRDTAIRNHVDMFKKLEQRLSDTNAQLESTRCELKDMMLDNVRNSSFQDGQKKCQIFESELENAKKCLKSPACRQLSTLPTSSKISSSTTVNGGSEEAENNTVCEHHPDVTRKESVLVQAKAILNGTVNSSDFILNNRQISWVYNSSFQNVLNSSLVSTSYASANVYNNKEDDTDEETDLAGSAIATATSPEPSSPATMEEPAIASSPSSEKRRIGSNRGMKMKQRSPSNGALDSIKAILSPATTRRKSLVPFESMKTQMYIP